MGECVIDNREDFNEPMELRYTDIDQVRPTIRGVDDILGNNLRRIREIEDELDAIGVHQFVEQGVNDAGMYRDAERGLEGIQLQSEKCGLEAGNQRLRENLQNLLSEAQRLARTTSEQFEKYKAITLSAIEGMMIMRSVAFGGEEVSYENEIAVPYFNLLIEHTYPYTDFFDISHHDLIRAFSLPNGLDDLYERIQGIPFE